MIGSAAFTERFLSIIKKHEVFLVQSDNATCPPVPGANLIPVWTYKGTPDIDEKNDTVIFSFNLQEAQISIIFSSSEWKVINLIDGQRSIGEINEISGLSTTEFEPVFHKIWNNLHGIGWLFLRCA